MGSYKCLQTFGKAIRRVSKNLPNSPGKKVAVVKKLALEVLGCDLDKIQTIREAYQFFKNSHPDSKIGKSAFYNLRPAEMLPVSYTSHVLCFCAQHSNILNQ